MVDEGCKCDEPGPEPIGGEVSNSGIPELMAEELCERCTPEVMTVGISM